MSKAYERLKALRDLTDGQVIDALQNDQCDVVRHEAAFVLGERRRERPHDNSVVLREQAFDALNKASFSDPSVLVRHEAVLALTAFASNTMTHDIIEAALGDSAPEVVSSARYALEELGYD
jgi:HEAT repeat protein